MPSHIVLKCSKMLADKGMHIAFAESATAGRLAFEFAMTPDSGKILTGGLVSYDGDVKKNVLGVTDELIKEFTPESSFVTCEMARLLKVKMEQARLKGDIVVATTGLTTPGGSESEDKPVGTMFYCIRHAEVIIDRREVFEGNPESIILQCIDRVAAEIITSVQNEGKAE